MINVGIDAMGYRPVNAKTIVNMIRAARGSSQHQRGRL